MEWKMLNAKLKDRIRTAIIRQRTRVTDIVQYVTSTTWKWAGDLARMKDNRWTIETRQHIMEWKINVVWTNCSL